MTQTASASIPASTIFTSTRAPGRLQFPDPFLWGSATSAYQIEGAHNADGKVPSIWDTFAGTAGRIADATDGTTACDHYNRVDDDVALMADLSLDAYRFSIAWTRVISDRDGTINEAGLDFYDRLVDALLDAGIRPFPTLYHWDLPQYLEDLDGWVNRDTAYRFADYTEAVVARLGDRIDTWTTLNEPFVSANHGYVTGEHAPGRTSMAEGMAASHHLLLAHGLAGERIRELAPSARLAITLNFTPVDAADDSADTRDRAQIVDELENRWYADPLGGYGYPETTAAHYGWTGDEVKPGDMALIEAPIDLLGVNFYTRSVIGADSDRVVPRNTMGWEVHPPSFGKLLRWIDSRYDFPAMLITENGCPMPDSQRDEDGVIVDDDRIAYISQHLAEVHDVISEGVPVEGYMVWSLFDNFEWAHGYGPTFGVVEVDLETQERRPKKSARWFANAARENGFDIEGTDG